VIEVSKDLRGSVRPRRTPDELLENSAHPEAEGMWARLEELVDKSKAERERFERLARKSSEAYMKVLKKPVEEHHHKIEEAKADLEEANPSQAGSIESSTIPRP
jgi:hypothetical protein